MEKISQDKYEISIDELKSASKNIANMYVQAVEQDLEKGDSLRSRIVNYYSVRPETEQELLNVLGCKSKDEISDYIQTIRSFTADKCRFIEQMEKLYELQDVHQCRRELSLQDRLATDEEYKLGAYADVLESQVRDAVLIALKNGYLPFQSGFREESERDQFIDFYNKNITIPEDVLKYLKELSVEAVVENFDDRTTLTLHPSGNIPIRLIQWKEIWNNVISGLPQADSEMALNKKLYGEHEDFRRKQDLLRNKL